MRGKRAKVIERQATMAFEKLDVLERPKSPRRIYKAAKRKWTALDTPTKMRMGPLLAQRVGMA